MKQLQRLLPPCTLEAVIRSTREQIVEVRKATNVAPCIQRTTKRNNWYDSKETLLNVRGTRKQRLEEARQLAKG